MSTGTQSLASRRNFIKQVGLLSAIPFAVPVLKQDWVDSVASKLTLNGLKVNEQDESYWRTIRECFITSPDFINLNNGGTCPHSIIVMDKLFELERKANISPQYFKKTYFHEGQEKVRDKLAGLAGCSSGEIAICRNATEALETLIFGIDLEKGDEIITSEIDYPSMLNALLQKAERDKVVIKKVRLPIPSTSADDVVNAFKGAITNKTRLILISHAVFVNGQLLPVREVCDMAHEQGVEVIVDAAHSFAHIDYKIPDLHCDYFGTSLHKWLCAPLGTGMLYIKKEKIEKVWPLFATQPDTRKANIRKFEHLGTRSWPTELAIETAIDFHNAIGSQKKENRLRYLKDYWANKIMEVDGVTFNTSMDRRYSCAIANFDIGGTDNHELSNKLLEEYNIYTQPIKHPSIGGVRVSPNIYTSLEELDKFVDAVKEIVKS